MKGRFLSEGYYVDLNLKYSGVFKSAQSKRRANHKHLLRMHFSKQLAVHWKQHETLSQYDPKALQYAEKGKNWFDVERPVGDRGLFWKHHIRAYNVIPLVTHIHLMHCHLAIRMHCPRGHGSILYEGGDIDNRLKVLLDALSMPQDESQIPSSVASADPDASEPLFCLLESDELVTKLSVEMFPLLDEDQEPAYVQMDIDVHVDPIFPMNANLPMLFR